MQVFSSENAEDSGVVSVFFLFGILLLGSVLIFFHQFQWKFNIFHYLPYTVMVFILGLVIGVLSGTVIDDNIIIDSIKLYDDFNPELVLYLFIPPLIFGEVANLNMHHLKSTLLQGILLAFPGALAGSIILALLMTSGYFIPFHLNWDYNVILLFSSILCATDPVSVVALLSKMELFRIQKLKYIITNEALLNDAAALILYTIFLTGNLRDQTMMKSWDIFIYSIHVAIVSPLVGFSFGLGSLAIMYPVSRNNSQEEYTIIKIIVPICAAFLSFFVSNYILKDSGILSVYCCGYIFSWLNPSFLKHNEAVHSVWIAIEWTANTLVFILAGMVIGYRSRPYFTLKDTVNVFIIYLLLSITRVIIVALFYPLLAWLGRGCSIKEAIFVAFSGLRGAISVSLALSFRLECENGFAWLSPDEGNRFFFYVGAIAAWTLIINATFAEYVLQVLKISEDVAIPQKAIEIMREYTKKRLAKAVMPEWLEIPEEHQEMLVSKCILFKLLDDYVPSDNKNEDEDAADTVRRQGNNNSGHTSSGGALRRSSLRTSIRVSKMKNMAQTNKHKHVLVRSTAYISKHPAEVIDEQLMDSVRGAFLECVRAYYWTRVQKGILSRHSFVTRTLTASIDLGLETTNTPGLQDWDYISDIFDRKKIFNKWSMVSSVYMFLQKQFEAVADYREREDEQLVTILSTFIAAHKQAQIKIPYYFGATSDVDTLEQALVIQESQSLVDIAFTRLVELQKEGLIEYRQTKEKALHILSRMESMLFVFREDAVITSSDLEHFLETITQDRHAIDKLFRSVTRMLSERHLLSSPLSPRSKEPFQRTPVGISKNFNYSNSSTPAKVSSDEDGLYKPLL